MSTNSWANDQYGAIAYSPSTGAHGYAINYANQTAAENRAIIECERQSGLGDCKAVIWFKNACGALATSPQRGYGSGWGTNMSVASNYAMQSCSRYNSNCQVITNVCTQ